MSQQDARFHRRRGAAERLKRRRRRGRTISEAHAQDRRIKHRNRQPSKLWWLAPIFIGAIGFVIFWQTGAFDEEPRTNKELAKLGLSEDEVREAQAKVQKAKSYREAGLPDKALPLLTEALEAAPALPDLAFELAFTHYELGNQQDARRFAQLSIDRNERIAKAHYLAGVSYCLDDQYQEALPHFKAAHRNFETGAGLFRNWADALRASGDYSMAQGKLEQALAFSPGSRLIQMKILLTRISSGEIDVVAQKVESDLKWSPELADLQTVAAAIALERGDYAKARESFQKIEEIAGPKKYADYLRDVFFLPYRRDPQLAGVFDLADKQAQKAEGPSEKDSSLIEIMAPPKPMSPFPWETDQGNQR